MGYGPNGKHTVFIAEAYHIHFQRLKGEKS
jgi:hypothetical protein